MKGFLTSILPLPLGKLVIADTNRAILLRTKHILIGNKGELHIGSPACPYKGNLTISLYGRYSCMKFSITTNTVAMQYVKYLQNEIYWFCVHGYKLYVLYKMFFGKMTLKTITTINIGVTTIATTTLTRALLLLLLPQQLLLPLLP